MCLKISGMSSHCAVGRHAEILRHILGTLCLNTYCGLQGSKTTSACSCGSASAWAPCISQGTVRMQGVKSSLLGHQVKQ